MTTADKMNGNEIVNVNIAQRLRRERKHAVWYYNNIIRKEVEDGDILLNKYRYPWSR